jgi:GNAT superfamily N-acetyltransferase
MSEATLQIRPAHEGDIPVLLHFVRQLAEYERLAHLVTATEDSLRESLFGSQPAAEALIAFDDGVPAGFAVYFHSFSTFLGRRGLWLEDLFVTPAARGKGIGKALLLRVARIAHERGCGRYEWSALDWNTPAIEFYESLGAVQMGEWKIFRVTQDKLAQLAGLDAGGG